MRDTWYADQRDLVKWGTLAHLAVRHSLATIIQVAYLRAGKRPPLLKGKDEIEIPAAVWSFFRKVSSVRRLGGSLRRRILVLDEMFVPRRRRQYLEAVVARLRGVKSPKVVLLDPDTGMAPTKPSGKHVTAEDIAAVWDVLRPGDWLAIYQHRSRRKTWKEEARDRFAALCGTGVDLYGAPKIASDVIFLTARKAKGRKA